MPAPETDPAPAAHDRVAAAALSAAREELLDLGLRNPLLDTRGGGRRSLEIVDERAIEVHRLLVAEARPLDFLPAADPLPGDPIPPDAVGDQPRDDGRPATRHLDRHLQTALRSETLQERLHTLAQTARALMEEQGVNVLSLALGMLHWRPEGDAETDPPRRAPLLLVPVWLDRVSAGARYVLRHNGEDPMVNLSLLARLRADLGAAPSGHEDDEALDPGAHFAEMEAFIAGRPGWRVSRDEIVLGLFTFGKFLLHRDLDEAAWPEDRRPSRHRVVRALLGEGFPAADAQVTPDEGALEVVDADSSQATALAAVAAGHDLVIEGPPGTGKSQTITNLIAQAVGAGKRVLFVAEKLAALEVVKRRFDQIGLGDLCLELHSHKSQKSEVLAELKRTFALGRPLRPDDTADRAALTEARARLDALRDALVTPLSPSGLSPWQALSHLEGIDEHRAMPRLPFTPLAALDADGFAEALARTVEVAQQLAALGRPAEHPFHGCRRERLLPIDAEALTRLCADAQRSARARSDALAALADALAKDAKIDAKIDAGDSAPDVRAVAPDHDAGRRLLLDTAQALLDAPDLTGLDPADPAWTTSAAEIDRALELTTEIEAQRTTHPLVLREAWPDDLLASAPALIEARADLLRLGRRWWRVLSPRWWRARKRLALLHHDARPLAADAALALIDALLAVRRRAEGLRTLDLLGRRVFRTRWRGWESPGRALTDLRRWIGDTRRAIDAGRLSPWLLPLAAQPPDPDRRAVWQAQLDAARAADTQAQDALQRLSAFLGYTVPPDEASGARRSEPSTTEEPDLDTLPDADLHPRLERWANEAQTLPDYCRYAAARAPLVTLGLHALAALADTWPQAPARLPDALRAAWYRGLIETAEAERPALSGYDPARHTLALRRFRALDAATFGHNRARLAERHHAARPDANSPPMRLLRREMEKKTRHLPLRRLLREAGPAIAALKPVFMMSPLSIATYLDPNALRFDLVVFDEASQVRPVDALGALARAEQAVVVGDSRQLPPTRFFERLIDSGDLTDEANNQTADLESVLSLFLAAGAPSKMLTWHYRSRHPALIALSNQLFYGGQLTLFPSPARDPDHTQGAGPAPDLSTDPPDGVHLRLLPDARYDRGRTRTNRTEAEAIANAVMQHAEERPDQTLGVVAFSAAQAEAIDHAIERRRRDDLSRDRFFTRHPHEPFFVKNLESVQGDERDVILISLGYGRDEQGRLPSNFGPLNLEGGERRLNVIITRARRRCDLYSSLQAEDLPQSGAAGVNALRAYLRHARDPIPATQGTQPSDPAPRQPDAPRQLIDTLSRALTERGHQLTRRVGTQALRLDLAIIDPDRPDRYLLGIEMDGELYQRPDPASHTCRERERLRQEVLTGLGWSLHRHQALHHRQDPQGALQAIEEAARQAARPKPNEAPTETPTEDPTWGYQRAEPIVANAVSEIPAFRPYEKCRGDHDLGDQPITQIPKERLAELIIEIVEAEGPIHPTHAVGRVPEISNRTTITYELNQAGKAAITWAIKQKRLKKQDGYLWSPTQQTIEPRDRTGLKRTERRTTAISQEERQATIEYILKHNGPTLRHDLIRTATRLLGLPQTEATHQNTKGPEAWQATLDHLTRTGTIQQEAGILRLAP